MMGFFDRIKGIMGLPEEEVEEGMDFLPTDNVTNYQTINKNNKVVNINTTTQLQVVLVKPDRYEDAGSIANHLNSKHTVVLNLEDTNREIARRLIDFLSGVAYANGGQIKKVAENGNGTYIITPYNVDIMGSLLDEIEAHNGINNMFM